MVRLRFKDEISFEASDFPLGSVRVNLDVEFTSEDVPEAAYQRYLVEALERLAQHAAEGQALPARTGTGGQTAPAKAAKAEDWTMPEGLHLKTAKSAHRFLVAAASLVNRGPAPMLGEVAEKAKLSGPPVAKIANPKTPAGKYIAPLIRVEKRGRTKVVDVTPLGRKVASLVRAGKLPS